MASTGMDGPPWQEGVSHWHPCHRAARRTPDGSLCKEEKGSSEALKQRMGTWTLQPAHGAGHLLILMAGAVAKGLGCVALIKLLDGACLQDWGSGVSCPPGPGWRLGPTCSMCSTSTCFLITALCLHRDQGWCQVMLLAPRWVCGSQCSTVTPRSPDDKTAQAGSEVLVEEQGIEGCFSDVAKALGSQLGEKGHGCCQPSCLALPHELVQYLQPAVQMVSSSHATIACVGAAHTCPREMPKASTGAHGYWCWMWAMAVCRSSLSLAEKVQGV